MEFKKREQILVLLAAICVGFFAADRLIITPLGKLWKKRGERIVELEQSLSEGRSLVDRESAMKERWQEMTSRSLPEDSSVAEKQILQSWEEWKRSSRLSMDSLNPRWIEEEDEPFKKIECRVKAEGNITELTRFLYELESDPQALRVEEVEISSRDENGRQLSLSLRFTGLVLLGEQR